MSKSIEKKAESLYISGDWGQLWGLEATAEKEGVDISYWTEMDDYKAFKSNMMREVSKEDAYDNARDIELELTTDER